MQLLPNQLLHPTASSMRPFEVIFKLGYKTLLLFEVGYNKKIFIKSLAFLFQSCIAFLGGGLKTTPLGV